MALFALVMQVRIRQPRNLPLELALVEYELVPVPGSNLNWLPLLSAFL